MKLEKEDWLLKELINVTSEEFKGWKQKNCIGSYIAKCSKCVFKGYNCDYFSEGVWVNNKSLCSKKFLNQKIEVGGILTKDEKEYLRAVIKPFRDRILNIRKEETERYYTRGVQKLVSKKQLF